LTAKEARIEQERNSGLTAYQADSCYAFFYLRIDRDRRNPLGHGKSPQDLFEDEAQPELFELGVAPPAYRPDPDQVRARLQNILVEARAAEKLPWDRDRLLVYRTIFPRMAGWPPEEEAAQLRFEFDAEMMRLKAA